MAAFGIYCLMSAFYNKYFENNIERFKKTNIINMIECSNFKFISNLSEVTEYIGILTKNKINSSYLNDNCLDTVIRTEEGNYFYCIKIRFITYCGTKTRDNLEVNQFFRQIFEEQQEEFIKMWIVNSWFRADTLSTNFPSHFNDDNHRKTEDYLYDRQKLIFKNITIFTIDLVLDFNKNEQVVLELQNLVWLSSDSKKCICNKKPYLIQIVMPDILNINSIVLYVSGFRNEYNNIYMKYMDEYIHPDVFINNPTFNELDKYLYNDVKNIILDYLQYNNLSISFTDGESFPFCLHTHQKGKISFTYKEIKNEKIKTKLFMVMCDEIC